MDKSKINHQNQSFNIGKGQAKVNLVNGRLLFEYPLITIGANSFQMSTMLSYNSNYKNNDFGNKKIGFGNGWKLNFHQYLIPYNTSYNIEGFESGDYLYIDSNWCIHRFKLYLTEGSVKNYYDTSGTGLRLKISGTSFIINDDVNNLYEFNSSGYLISYTSSINPNIKKVLTYQNNNLVSIHDERKNSRKIIFNYDLDGKLIEVKNTLNCLGYNLIYNGNKLDRIDKYTLYKNNKETKSEVEFLYDTDELKYIVNSSDNLGLEICYDSSLIPKVSKTSIVRMERECVIEEGHEVYLGENVHLGEDVFLTNSSSVFKKYNLSVSNEDKKLLNSFEYLNEGTIVTNDKGIMYQYSFNLDKTLVSCLERKTSGEFYTTYIPNGWNLITGIVSTDKINGEKSVLLNSLNDFTYNVPEDCIISFKGIFNVDENGDGIKDEAYTENFIISFWMKYFENSKEGVLAKINYTVGLNAKSSIVRIEDTPVNSWQYVSIPVNLGTNQSELSNIYLSFEGCDNSTKVLVNGIRIDRGEKAEINIIDSNENYYPLTIGTYLKVSNELKKIDANFYMSENDMFATYKSIYFSKENNKNTFEMTYNNGKNISIVNQGSLKFIIPNVQNGEVILDVNNGRANYCIKKLDIVDTRTFVTNYVKTFFCKENNEYYYKTEVKVEKVEIDDANVLENTKETISTLYSSTNHNGSKRYDKDSNYVVTKYIYDEYGNIKFVKKYKGIYDSSDIKDLESDEIINSYFYELDENNSEVLPIYRENVNKEIKDNITYTYIYNSDGYITNISNGKTDLLYKYDQYYETINGTEFDENIEHKQYYFRNGNIREIKDCFGNNYNYSYNKLFELKKVYKNKDLIIELSREDNSSGTIEQYQVNKENNLKCIDTFEFDKYGRQVKYTNSTVPLNNEYETIFKYEEAKDASLSSSIKRVTEINDPFSNETNTFIYSEYKGANFKRHFKKEGNNVKLEITSYSNDVDTYSIKEDEVDIMHVIEKDPSNGNIKKVQNVRQGTYLDRLDAGYEEFNYSYYYDDCNRYKGKENLETVIYTDVEPTPTTTPTVTTSTNIHKHVNYLNGDTKPNSLVYVVGLKTKYLDGGESNTPASLWFESHYDQYGNIISTGQGGNRFLENYNEVRNASIETLPNYYTYYSYDKYNRLINENIDSTNYQYIYSNSTGMLEKIIKNNNVIRTFTYNDKGILTKVNNDDIIYDRYGNIIRIGSVNITYNSRGLMDTYSYINNEQKEVKYKYYYNYQGVRYKKEKYECINNLYVLKETHNYYLSGSTILGEDIIGETGVVDKLRYYYDAEGICGIKYNDNNYVLIKDSLGNVSKVLYKSKLIGEYVYDAWGNQQVNEVGTITNEQRFVLNNNPFRYRGYYYDVETNLFLVSSRYYSPELCRWISPDDIEYLDPESVNGLNLYCYCLNDPVNNVDPTGHFAISALIIGAVFGFAGTMLTDWLDDRDIFNGSQDWRDYVGNILGGAIGGLAGAMNLNMLGSMVFSVAGDTIGGLFSGDINSWESFGQTVALSIGISIFSSGISSAVSDAFGTSQYKAIRGVSTKNIKVNNYIKGLKGSFKRAGVTSLKIGRNSMDDFLRALRKTTSNVIVTEIAGNMVSTSLGIWF